MTLETHLILTRQIALADTRVDHAGNRRRIAAFYLKVDRIAAEGGRAVLRLNAPDTAQDP